MRSNTIARRADAFVHWTRLDRVTLLGHPERRNLRWWPALALVVMVIGYALVVTAIDDRPHSISGLFQIGVGGLLLFGAMGTAGWLRMLGPRLAADLEHKLDERERMLRARAGHIGGRIIALLTIAGCFYFGAARPLGLWMPTQTIDWVYLGVMVEGWALVLPVLVASWLQPRLDRD
jgi:hypothetical protein